jgi:hypothetical protein
MARAVVLVLVIWAAIALAPGAGWAAPLTPAEVREVEDRVLAARRAIRTCELVIVCRYADPAGKALPARDYDLHVWWDGLRTRIDRALRPADPAPDRWVDCWQCERDGFRLCHHPDQRQPQLLGTSAFAPITPADGPAERPPDPRTLGLIPFPFLCCYDKPLDTLIGRPGRTNLRGDRTGEGEREVVTIEFDASPTLRGRARVEPAKGHAVTQVEWVAVGPDRKTLTGTWTLETEYKEVPRTRVWFPAAFTYTDTAGGKETERHRGTVTVASLNERLDPKTFTLAGMGLPPGTVITNVPADGGIHEWTEAGLRPWDPRKAKK